MPIALTMFLDVLPEEVVFFFSPQPFSHSNLAAAHFIGWHTGGYAFVSQFRIKTAAHGGGTQKNIEDDPVEVIAIVVDVEMGTDVEVAAGGLPCLEKRVSASVEKVIRRNKRSCLLP
ncbi:hypothetical protein Nepgr_006200 [Nepenthes gracilis]|uniref:Uncharacterized protein n=1 Tax=Nepenthes gracilis TaxID=150966 RepID=A0AAD3S4S2_NEPGR|nr:hypothetical protein Nepgr_006200 [Nepenthes gracilis]